MANEFIARKGLIALADSQITGSLNLTGNVTTTGTISGEFASSTGTAISGAFTSTSESIASDISTNSSSIASLEAASGSYLLNTTDTFTGDLTVTGEVIAQTLNVQQVTSSIVYSSGSNQFGNSVSNTQQFTGSLQVSGSTHYVLGNVGIGESNPIAKLDVKNNSNRVLRVVQEDTALSNATYTFEIDSSAQTSNMTTAGAMAVDVNSGRAFTINGFGNVGIGGSPQANTKLHISDSGTEGIEFQVAHSSNVNRILSYNRGSAVYNTLKFDGLDHQFFTSGTEKVRITNAGNVGIGTTSPDSKLHVNTSNQLIARFASTNTGITGVRMQGVDTSATDAVFVDWVYDAENRKYGFGEGTSSGNLPINSGLTHCDIVVDSGNVGIGTDSPAYKVHSTGTGRFGNMLIGSGTYLNTIQPIDDTNMNINTPSGSIYFNTQGGSGVYNSAGNFGIGTTSPETLLEVQQSSVGSDGVTFDANASNRATLQFQVNTNYTRIQSYGRGTSSGYLSLNPLGNNVGIGTTSPISKLHLQGTGTYNWNPSSESLTSDCTIVSSEMSNDQYNSILQLVSVRQSLSTGNASQGFLGFSTVDDSNGQGIRDAGRIAIVNETTNARNSPTALSFWTNPGGTSTTTPNEAMRIASNGNVAIGTNGVQNYTPKTLMIGNGNTDGMVTGFSQPSGTGSNSVAGRNLILRGGVGTGAGANGDIIFKGADTLVYGNQLPHSEVERARILSSGGITFNGDTAAANALDDYEEGTISTFVNGITATTNSVTGIYTKIGNMVYAQVVATIAGKSSGTGNPYIPLPFTPSADNIGQSKNGANFAKNTMVSGLGYLGLYGANAQVYANTTSGGYIGESSWSDGDLSFTIVYRVN